MKTLSALGPSPPPGSQPPTLWGTREHVEELFAGTGIDVRFEDSAMEFRFDSAEEAIDEYCARFGPVVMLRRLLEAEGRDEEVRIALRELFTRWNELDEGEGLRYPGAYLMTLGQKRA